MITENKDGSISVTWDEEAPTEFVINLCSSGKHVKGSCDCQPTIDIEHEVVRPLVNP